MLHASKIRFLLFIAALVLLAVVDYIGANALQQESRVREVQRLREQDANQFKRHIRLCSLAEIICKLNYNAAVAIGGYSITRKPMFAARFEQLAAESPERVRELRQLVSAVPEEEAIVQSVGKLSEKIFAVSKEAKAMMDDPKAGAENQVRARHFYKTLRADADQVQKELDALRDKDFAVLNNTLQTLPPPKSRISPILFLAFLNAICGSVLVWLLGIGRQVADSADKS